MTGLAKTTLRYQKMNGIEFLKLILD